MPPHFPAGRLTAGKPAPRCAQDSAIYCFIKYYRIICGRASTRPVLRYVVRDKSHLPPVFRQRALRFSVLLQNGADGAVRAAWLCSGTGGMSLRAAAPPEGSAPRDLSSAPHLCSPCPQASRCPATGTAPAGPPSGRPLHAALPCGGTSSLQARCARASGGQGHSRHHSATERKSARRAA